VWGEVGQFLKAAGLAGNILAKRVIHGVVGGALSVAQGGTFMDGFVANAIGGATGVLSEGTAIGSNIYTDTALVALSGGLAAELTGGKFANGAITAAFANLFNKWGGVAGATKAASEGLDLVDDAFMRFFGPSMNSLGARLPFLPPGMSQSFFGRNVMRWGNSLEGAKPWYEHLMKSSEFTQSTISRIQSSGTTKEMIGQWYQFYTRQFEQSGSMQFFYRAQGFRHIHQRLPGTATWPCTPETCT